MLARVASGLLGIAPGLETVLETVTGLLVAAPGLLEETSEVQLQRPHVFAQKPFGLAELVVSMKDAEHCP